MIVPGDLATFIIRQCVCLCAGPPQRQGWWAEASVCDCWGTHEGCELLEAATPFSHMRVDGGSSSIPAYFSSCELMILTFAVV